MRLTDRLNLAQRIVIVVATGNAVAAIGIYLEYSHPLARFQTLVGR